MNLSTRKTRPSSFVQHTIQKTFFIGAVLAGTAVLGACATTDTASSGSQGSKIETYGVIDTSYGYTRTKISR